MHAEDTRTNIHLYNHHTHLYTPLLSLSLSLSLSHTSSYMAMLQSYSPITEREREGLNDHPSPRGGCTCFRRFCFGSTDSYLLPERGGSHEQPPWLVAQLHKLKHFTERVAGPKWKNLVRRIGKLCNPKRQEEPVQFQYSPESYALNFAGGDPEEDAVLLHSFSTRFAAPMNDQKRGGIL